MLLSSVLFNSGCTKVIDTTMNKDMSTSVKMSDSIFLEPVSPAQQTVWIKIRNTSDKQEIDATSIKNAIATRVTNNGYKVVNDATAAHYRLDANLLYADEVKGNATAQTMVAGGFAGALVGAAAGGDWTSAAIGGGVGALGGAVFDMALSVKTVGMVIDIQVSEFVEGGVTTSTRGTSRSGGGTGQVGTVQTKNSTSDFLHHRTRIAATAKQTNLEMAEAAPVLINQISASLAGVF